MNWQEFIDTLLRDFRMSSLELEQKTSVSNASISQLRTGKTKKPNQFTIKNLEKGLGIRINDRDPDKITYTKLSEKELEPGHEFKDTIPAYKYPLLGVVYAGEPDLLDHELTDEYEYFPYRKNSNRCFSLRVNGKSMETTVQDGAVVLADMDAQLTDGCLVAVKLKNGTQYIKRYYNLNYVFVKLSSDNPEYGVRLIDKSDILVCYRIVMINLPL
jgi:phage repressor protein C with HTH and peptisase S24 domain